MNAWIQSDAPKGVLSTDVAVRVIIRTCLHWRRPLSGECSFLAARTCPLWWRSWTPICAKLFRTRPSTAHVTHTPTGALLAMDRDRPPRRVILAFCLSEAKCGLDRGAIRDGRCSWSAARTRSSMQTGETSLAHCYEGYVLSTIWRVRRC